MGRPGSHRGAPVRTAPSTTRSSTAGARCRASAPPRRARRWPPPGPAPSSWSAAGLRRAAGRRARDDPSTDTWRSMSSAALPRRGPRWPRPSPAPELLIWGGQTGTDGLGAMVLTQTGGRYDPASDTWLGDLPVDGAPAARAFASGVWTGGELIVGAARSAPATSESRWWPGTGGRYRPGRRVGRLDLDPVRDGDTELAGHAAAWTGVEMVVWAATPPAPPVAATCRRSGPGLGVTGPR